MKHDGRGRGRRAKALSALIGMALLAAACQAVPNDYSGDRKADLVWFAQPDHTWHEAGAADPIFTGQAGDLPVAGDYDGNGRWEPAVLRGRTWISATAGSIVYDPAGMPAGPAAQPWYPMGGPTLVPVPADYDGDGKTDPAYYDLVDGTWWIMGQPSPVAFGNPPTSGGSMGYDVPVPADYNGDGKADIAIYRPSDSTFHILSTGQVIAVGQPGDLPVPAAYNGGSRAEAATYRQDTNQWFIDGQNVPVTVPGTIQFDGTNHFQDPAPADYDGDGRVDPAQVDETTGAWVVQGQGTVTTIGAPNPPVWDTTLAPNIVMNLVRIYFIDVCLHNPGMALSYPAHCPANP